MLVRIAYHPGPFDSVHGPSHDSKSLGAFEVSVPPADPLPLRYLRVGGQSFAVMLGRVGDDEQRLREALIRHGLARLERDIGAGAAVADLPRETTLVEGDCPDLTLGAKTCAFQQRQPAGLVCTAAAPKDRMRGLTSVPICEQCDLPGDEVRCSALVHPQIDGYQTHRLFSGGLCDAGHDERLGEPKRCALGGHECWHRLVSLTPRTVVVAADVAERLLDEFSYVRVALDRLEGVRIKPSPGDLMLARTILSPCPDQGEFTMHLTATAALLAQLDGRSAARDLGEAPADLGQLQALDLVLTARKVSGHSAAIAALRDVSNIRRLVPVHGALDASGLQACGRFGISPPISDHAIAWGMIAERTRLALRDIRLSVEAAASLADDDDPRA